jgi:hypothetical protein
LPVYKSQRKESDVNMTVSVNVIKLFSFIADNEAQKVKVFALGNPFHSGLRI